MRRILLVLSFLLPLTACGPSVPDEVKTAMVKQAAELKELQTKQQQSVDVLFASIRTLQLAILADREQQIRASATIGCKMINQKLRCYDDNNHPFRADDPDVVERIIPVDNEKTITDFFNRKRTETQAALDAAKAEFLKQGDHIKIAQQINDAVSEYIDSLIRHRNAQRELAATLSSKISFLPQVAGLQQQLLKASN